MNLEKNITIDFGNAPGDSDGDDSENLAIALDAAKNAEVYGGAKTTFAPNESAYLMLTGVTGPYTLASSAGSLRKFASRIYFEVVELVSFAKANSGALSYKPVGRVACEWIGRDYGDPRFVGKNVYVLSDIVGVLQCTYQAAKDQLKLFVTADDMNGRDEIDVLAAVTQSGATITAAVPYALAEEETVEPVPVDIRVVDYCTGEIVAGASVYVDGELVGQTGEDGSIALGNLLPGSEHTLVMTAPGYIDSEADTLCNDSFTVPA